MTTFRERFEKEYGKRPSSEILVSMVNWDKALKAATWARQDAIGELRGWANEHLDARGWRDIKEKLDEMEGEG